ncbi:lipoprotein [Lacrimispora indolis]|uniref:lipoprotein n=1 Tax=Lacrimispora indolis TaxID=69825 RepID=UPI0012ECA827|nr:lipoprotein [Lacrimispora indolis]
MKKILLTLGVGLVLTGCSSGISQSQYESVVAEYSYENSIGDTFIFTLLKTILIRL